MKINLKFPMGSVQIRHQPMPVIMTNIEIGTHNNIRHCIFKLQELFYNTVTFVLYLCSEI
jgi:hypothetical protein